MMSGSQRGMTLLEILIVVSIIGIVAAFGVPAIGGLVNESRVNARAEQLLASLQFARSEAIRTRQDIGICALGNNNGCSNNNAADWNNGWLVVNGAQVLQRIDAAGVTLAPQAVNGVVPLRVVFSRTMGSNVSANAFALGNGCRLVNVATSGRASLAMGVNPC